MTADDSRSRVLATLRSARSPLRGDELAASVGLSLTTTRFHLARLIRAGLVRAGKQERDRPGRPNVVYRAVPAEAVEAGSAYRLLAGVLATQLSRSGDPTLAVQAGESWARQVLAGMRRSAPAAAAPGTSREAAPGTDQQTAPGTGREAAPGTDQQTAPGTSREAAPGRAQQGLPAGGAVSVLLELLDEGGFEPRLAPDGAEIELLRCPFLDLAVERSDIVCAVHQGFADGILQGLGDPRTARLSVLLDGSGPCRVRLVQHPRPDRRIPSRP